MTQQFKNSDVYRKLKQLQSLTQQTSKMETAQQEIEFHLERYRAQRQRFKEKRDSVMNQEMLIKNLNESIERSLKQQEFGRAAQTEKFIENKQKSVELAQLEFKKKQLEEKFKQLELLSKLKGAANVTSEDVALYNSIDELSRIDPGSEERRRKVAQDKYRDAKQMVIKPSG